MTKKILKISREGGRGGGATGLGLRPKFYHFLLLPIAHTHFPFPAHFSLSSLLSVLLIAHSTCPGPNLRSFVAFGPLPETCSIDLHNSTK